MVSNDMVEIRWHGRGGQGAKTACMLLADAAGLQGKFVQGFPEYGPERMGAPITAYNRISEQRCTIHSFIYDPNYVVVVDETLLDSIDVTGGLKASGAIIINTPCSPQEMRPRLRGWTGKVCTIDARRISEEILGRNLPNTPMLGAVVKVSGVLESERFLVDIEESFQNKFAGKPQLIQGNLATLKKSMEEVQIG
ncbi:MAG: 2-oxoacid:acceptor oxidoreductase family protein [Syntrophomonadaceae bacterium]|nr:2-oxoacid:acceptor oxidoreductase family protein [Syntrophomonadaceae bacterium]MDD3271189.1 2-oxoacid:acceptor oxidoreductase family protein [Syntrophomonadaceae bacterium]MDD3898084.1 2-oxoacid:acceptor oxidoreductase family protein [Syntrophomonadaceae bacterium]MDD4562825.1 2-oxoacid:acceptor oxidoreductase family protein [Syntrophomonadaceae bacterium]